MFEIIAVLIAFGCGYGVRELISRRRRAAVRERFLLRSEKFARREQIDNRRLMAKLGLNP
jgi:hypothetical protein